MKPYSLDQVRGPLRAAMMTRGSDFVYRPNYGSEQDSSLCYNTPISDDHWRDLRANYPLEPEHMKETGCLIGTMLSNLGIPIPVQHRASAIETFELYFTASAIDYLAVAQGKQDKGSSWGEAVDAAEDWRTRWLDRGEQE